jgi:DNA repair protein RecO (recombination protein O)
MQWRDESVVLSASSFSENSRIVTVFNRSIGKSSGLLRGTKSSIQAGDISDVTWRGKTIEHLGSFKIENIFSPFGHVFKDAYSLFAIECACAICINGLPIRALHEKLFDSLKELMIAISKGNWYADYVFFEMLFLSEIGYGLNFSKCAVTGKKNGLYYVSPRTGCAVTKEAGIEYGDRLFQLPEFMISKSRIIAKSDMIDALKITGHFLKMYFQEITGKDLPLSRNYLLGDMFAR